ncbi:MAG TPA: class I SAM-dependent methyltransferase [Dyella sp.]|uniref:class I SAM-dependent methyltransferase n=1 Tax=Dyella sp. TaxID=1869338 RepID=UPI002BF01A7D|nr:class I SAM-dependent methyltransferase [Dyella sp.]HUB91789.1 class I SAM-dependent methyltransferase [Dyella sp.]
MTAQNIYDDPAFFAGYAQLPRSKAGLSAVYEWPAFQRLLPASLDGLRILDLGCGLGYFAREAVARGARSVLGVDLSQRMLDQARTLGGDHAITYLRAALEEFVPGTAVFDLVVSSLALHYVADYRLLVKRVATALVPGGRFAFSVEHPIFTAQGSSAWATNADGAKLHWPVDRYRDEGERRTHWFVDDVVKYHRTIETYVNGLLEAGLVLARLEEPEATPAELTEHPEWLDERRRPPFLLMAADRPKD